MTTEGLFKVISIKWKLLLVFILSGLPGSLNLGMNVELLIIILIGITVYLPEIIWTDGHYTLVLAFLHLSIYNGSMCYNCVWSHIQYLFQTYMQHLRFQMYIKICFFNHCVVSYSPNPSCLEDPYNGLHIPWFCYTRDKTKAVYMQATHTYMAVWLEGAPSHWMTLYHPILSSYTISHFFY